MTPALRVIRPPDVKWVLAFPNNGSGRKAIVASQASGEPRNCRFRYIPSIMKPSRCSDENTVEDNIGRHAILCLFLETQQTALWIVWGTIYGDFEHYPGDPGGYNDYSTRPWCRILNPQDLGGCISSELTTLADLRSWASEGLAGCYEFVKGEAAFAKQWGLEFDWTVPKRWTIQGSDRVQGSHGGDAYSVMAEVRHVDFLGSTMYELEIKVITSGDGAG